MTTETKDQLKETVAAVGSFIEEFKDKEHGPLKEEVERLSAQITESMRASKRAALLQAGRVHDPGGQSLVRQVPGIRRV